MARWTERDSKRFARWIGVVLAPAMVILTLLDGSRTFWWECAKIVLWTLLGLQAAYRLIKERPGNA
jgi:hypothetical protein